MLDPGKLFDQKPIVAVHHGIGTSPMQTRNRLPGLLCRVTLMANEIGGVGQAGAMVPRDTMKKDRLAGGVGQQVRSQRHLFRGCPRASHGNDNPANTGLPDDLDLVTEFGVGGVDRRECHDGPDRLATDDPAERAGLLPGSPHELSRDDHLHSLLEPDVAMHDQKGPRSKAQDKDQAEDQVAREPTLHSPNLSQEGRNLDRRIQFQDDQTPGDLIVPREPEELSAQVHLGFRVRDTWPTRWTRRARL